MTRVLSGPLEVRTNASNWARLFDLALPALDHAMSGEAAAVEAGQKARWTLGGGTALALQIGHRRSDDIDVFLSGVRLADMTPAKNPFAGAISERFQWPGHYLKFERPEGEIDFLGSPLQTIPGYTLQSFRGRTVALETPEEVLTKKLRYRAADFTERDAFDLACILKARPEVAVTLATEVADTLPRARLALERSDPAMIRAMIRDPAPEFIDVLENATSQALKAIAVVDAIAAEPMSEESAEQRKKIEAAVASIGSFHPGARQGMVWIEWAESIHIDHGELEAAIRARPLEAKAAVLSAWRSREPLAFEAWNAGGRLPSEPERSAPASVRPAGPRRDRTGGRDI